MNSLTVKTISLKDANLDSTYFRTSDITPEVNGDTVTVYNGYGTRRSWGSPSVNSTVKILTENVVMVEVTGWHKWTVSPVGGSYYFVNENGTWTRRTANHKTVKAALTH